MGVPRWDILSTKTQLSTWPKLYTQSFYVLIILHAGLGLFRGCWPHHTRGNTTYLVWKPSRKSNLYFFQVKSTSSAAAYHLICYGSTCWLWKEVQRRDISVSISKFIANMHVEIWWSRKICFYYTNMFFICTITQFSVSRCPCQTKQLTTRDPIGLNLHLTPFPAETVNDILVIYWRGWK